jgi:hypothetical protein
MKRGVGVDVRSHVVIIVRVHHPTSDGRHHDATTRCRPKALGTVNSLSVVVGVVKRLVGRLGAARASPARVLISRSRKCRSCVAHDPVVAHVAGLGRACRRINDVGEQDGGADPVGLDLATLPCEELGELLEDLAARRTRTRTPVAQRQRSALRRGVRRRWDRVVAVRQAGLGPACDGERAAPGRPREHAVASGRARRRRPRPGKSGEHQSRSVGPLPATRTTAGNAPSPSGRSTVPAIVIPSSCHDTSTELVTLQLSQQPQIGSRRRPTLPG